MEVKPAAFARLTGVSRQSVSGKIKSKTLIVNTAGMLDTENPINAEYLAGRRRQSKEITETEAIARRKRQSLIFSVDNDPQTWDNDTIAAAIQAPKELLGLTLRQIVLNYGNLLGLEKHTKILKDLVTTAEKELKMQERSLTFIKKDFVTSRLFQFIDVLMKQLLEYPDSVVDEIMAIAISQEMDARPHIITLMKQGLGKVIAGSKDHIVKELNGLREKYSEDDNLEKIERIKEIMAEDESIR
jgi:hypothetical protein